MNLLWYNYAMKRSLALAQKKNPQDDNHHLAYSLTRHALAGDDYSALTTRRGFKHRQSSHEQELARLARHAGWWQTLEHEIAENNEGFIKVKKFKHRRSPYVVRLPAKAIPAAPLESAKTGDEVWRKEVARLRQDGAERFRRRADKVRVNFLKKSRQRVRSLGLWLGLAGVLPRAAAKLILDLALSVPLGFLLILHLILKITEGASVLTARVGLWAGRWLAAAVQAMFLAAVGTLAAGVAIPIKLIVLILLSLYRLMSLSVLGLMRLANIAGEISSKPWAVLKHRPRSFFARLLATAAIAGLIIAPLKFFSDSAGEVRSVRGRVLGAARDGLSALAGVKNSVEQGEAEAARESLALAGLKFSAARDSLSGANVLLRSLIKLTPQGQGGENLIAAGQALAKAGEEITIGLSPFISQSGKEVEVISAVKNLSVALALALPAIASARESLGKVDPKIVPEAYRSQLAATQIFLPEVETALSEFTRLADTLLVLLGSEGDKHYAVLFQNNNELRPAGGFIGSLALITVRAGRIAKIDIPGGGSYDFQGYLTKHVLAPKPLSLINPHWQLQDANWYPDWPTSAEKVAWFLENSGQTSVDGVIALQATTFQDLLRLLGPIEFPEYNVTLNADNVLAETQAAVELNYDKAANQPKQYIAELAPRIIDKILASTSGQFLDMLDLIRNAIVAKNILIYLRDKELNQQFIDRGWEPTVAASERDYLSIIHANIGGGKTDGAIEEQWRQNITISADGTAMAELTVGRHHRGNPNDQFEKSNNVDFVRVYAPAGSEFISAQGFKPPAADLFEKPADFYEPDEQLSAIEGKVLIDETTGTRINNEFGKTVFGNWLQVSPGNTAVGVIRYKLPFKIKPNQDGYSLIMQKQAGARPLNFSVAIEYPAAWQVAWNKTVGDGTIEDGAPGLVTFTGTLRRDTGFAVLFTEEK